MHLLDSCVLHDSTPSRPIEDRNVLPAPAHHGTGSPANLAVPEYRPLRRPSAVDFALVEGAGGPCLAGQSVAARRDLGDCLAEDPEPGRHLVGRHREGG